MTPKQKAQFVLLVQKHVVPRPVTLAIGDGANDVNMIMSAQVGVGISGLEGRQAVNASDFSIAQFRFLRRLMLAHGRWDYRRSVSLVLYSFYKNSCLALCLFFHSFETGFSGTPLFHEHFCALFNFYMLCVIFWLAVLDRDVDDDDWVDEHPELYESGRENLDCKPANAVSWQLTALVHAALVYFIPRCALARGTGAQHDLGAHGPFGTVVATALIVLLNVKALMETHTLVRPLPPDTSRGAAGLLAPLVSNQLIFLWSLLFYFLGTLIASAPAVCRDMSWFMDMMPYWNVGPTALFNAHTWPIVLLVVGTVAAVDVLHRALKYELFFDDVSLAIERFHLARWRTQGKTPIWAWTPPANGLKNHFASPFQVANNLKNHFAMSPKDAKVAPDQFPSDAYLK